MKIKFEYHKKTKQRWRYKAISVNDAATTVMQKKHTELIIFKSLLGTQYPPATITIDVAAKNPLQFFSKKGGECR
jgi:hypothetical protein